MEVAAAGPSFGEANFGAAELGDRRRTRRLVRAVDTMARQPAGTRPDKFDAPAGLKGLYRLLGDPAVTHASVFAPARARTLQRMAAAAGPVLVPHDWTELDSTGRRSLHDALGPIGNGSRRGYLCANALAVAAGTRAVLGLVYQKLAVRPTVRGPETRAQRRTRADRETRLWRDASRQVPAAAAGRLQVEVADRGADVLEFLDFVTAAGKSYLVRPEHNRRVERADGARAKLHDDARSLPRMGERRVSVGATAGRPKRDARVGVGWGPFETV